MTEVAPAGRQTILVRLPDGRLIPAPVVAVEHRTDGTTALVVRLP